MVLNKEDTKSWCWQIRIEAYRKFGFTKEALEDDDENVRMEAYNHLGFTNDAFHDYAWLVRNKAYNLLGFTKRALKEEDGEIRNNAIAFFKRCKEIIGSSEEKYTFTKEEVKLLELNGLFINKEIIID